MQTTFELKIDQSKLDNMGPRVREALQQAIGKIAKDIEADAKTTVPVDTGFLKNSILARQVTPMLWRVNVGANYGIYVEFGTRFMAARPYFVPAVDKMRSVFESVVAQAAKRAIEGEG